MIQHCRTCIIIFPFAHHTCSYIFIYINTQRKNIPIPFRLYMSRCTRTNTIKYCSRSAAVLHPLLSTFLSSLSFSIHTATYTRRGEFSALIICEYVLHSFEHIVRYYIRHCVVIKCANTK